MVDGVEVKKDSDDVHTGNRHVDEVIDSVVHFGVAWEKHVYVSEGHPMMEILHLVPPVLGQKPIFQSQIILNTSKGPMPIGFAIDALSLDEAVQKWRHSAQMAIKAFHEQMEQSQRRIVVPEPGKVPPKLVTH